MRRFFALATVLFTTAAYADATLTCALTGAGAANMSVPLVVSDVDGARILAAAVKSYSPVTVAPAIASNDARCATTKAGPLVPGPNPGDPQVPGPPVAQTPDVGCLPTFRAATNREAITSLLTDMLKGTLLSNVKESEKFAAAKTAADAITSITPK